MFPVMGLQNNTNWYPVNTMAIVLIIAFAFVGQKSKRGIVPGALLTPMTAADDEKWARVHKVRAITTYIIFIPLLIVNTVFYIKYPEGTYSFTMAIVVSLCLLAYSFAITIYLDILERRWLAEQKRKGHPVSDFEFVFPGITKKRLIIGTIVLVAVVVGTFVIQYLIARFGAY